VKKSSFHESAYSEFMGTAKLCACCDDEQSPYGAWVKSTYREWKEGPYGELGVQCHDCHMHYAPGKASSTGETRTDIAHHTFQGAHVPSKLAGAVDVALYAARSRMSPGRTLKLSIQLFNGKAGHFIPTGSTEERMLWLEVTAKDASEGIHRLPIKEKGFKGEEFTIADPQALAYQAMGEIMGLENFPGVSRDGDVPAGSRIFRRPFFDPKGRMTICQWYTAENEKVDYRIGPRQTRIEEVSWKLPIDLPKGPIEIRAALFYSLVPSSVGRFLELPEEEYTATLVNEASIIVEVI
jgi:hypothetical protein